MFELNFENHTSHLSVRASDFGLFPDTDSDSDTDPEMTVTGRQKGQER